MSKPKKVAILYAGAKHWGGVETYLEQLFVGVDPTKLDLTLVSIGEWELGERLVASGFKTQVIAGNWYNLTLVNKLAKYFKTDNYDLVTGQGLVANFYGRLSAHKAQLPNLITIHSDYKFDYQGFKAGLYHLTFKLFESYTAKYVVVSNFLKKEAMKLGVSDGKISVIYNGVKELSVEPKKRESTIIFGSLGRLHYKKGYQLLIQAVTMIRELDFEVHIWGEGDDRVQLENQIQQNKLESKIYLEGFTKDIPSALSKIDIYIQPSLEEGFGITVVEGMYAGKPVIVTPAGSLPELVTDGKTGLIANDVSPESIATAMKALIESPELCNKLALAGHIEAKKRFGVDTWIAEIERVYLETAR